MRPERCEFESPIRQRKLETEPRVWHFVDDVLPSPIDTAELRRRLGTLARIRTQSMTLERKTEQLRLLKRITQDIRNEMPVVTGWIEHLGDHTDDEHDEIRQRIRDSSQHVVDLTKTVREFVDIRVTESGGTARTGDADLGGASIEVELPKELSTSDNIAKNDA